MGEFVLRFTARNTPVPLCLAPAEDQEFLENAHSSVVPEGMVALLTYPAGVPVVMKKSCHDNSWQNWHRIVSPDAKSSDNEFLKLDAAAAQVICRRGFLSSGVSSL